MALTDTAIKAAKPADKPVKMTDGDGLYLLIHPNGGKWWRFDYRFDGKRKTLSMGVYPEVSLRDARDRRDEARRKIANQIDPGEHRKTHKNARADAVANNFETVAREWFTKMLPTWSPDHADKIIRRLERDVFPWIGGKPIADLNAPEVLTTIRRIEARGRLETAHRALQNCGQVFRYAVATGRRTRPHRRPTRRPTPDSREASACTHRSGRSGGSAAGYRFLPGHTDREKCPSAFPFGIRAPWRVTEGGMVGNRP